VGPLWEATRDLHHRAEQHPVAQRMANGTTTAQEWADWMHAHWQIQQVLDPHLPSYVRRTEAFARDLLELLPVRGSYSPAAKSFTSTLTDPVAIFGAAYLLVGAHRRGGRVIEKALRAAGQTLPAHHVEFDRPQDVELFVRDLRERLVIADGVKRAFAALIEVLDEIEERRNGDSAGMVASSARGGVRPDVAVTA
jgi:hypothetical protein